jgi:hypothetical protein
MKNTTPNFAKIRENNTTGYIPRKNLGKVTDGLISPKYAANLDSLGTGIKGRFRVGRQIAYPVDSVVEFLESRVEVLG